MSDSCSEKCQIETVIPQLNQGGIRELLIASLTELVNVSIAHMSESIAHSYEQEYQLKMDGKEMKRVSELECARILEEIARLLKENKVKN